GQAYTSSGFFKTGTQPVYQIKTFRGHEIKATRNHKMLVDNNGEEEWKEVGDLVLGDQLVVGQNEAFNANVDLESNDFKKGWLVGQVVGD
ncbi:hypothetical protein P9279_30555, partial [Mesorhizobium sp. WSM4962]|uniref:Hint domain-containing protein n=1 Tax=Mesorhizobium sp. WSM4962 TaxID=3038548 RepID=UPI0024162763